MAIQLAVVMRHQPIDNPWITHQWVLEEVSVDMGQFATVTIQEAFSVEQIRAYRLSDNQQGKRWLYTGFDLDVYADEAEGYFLNVSSEKPCWFVMWRLEEEPQAYINPQSQAFLTANEALAIPHRILVSYNEAARLLDGGEAVDNILMSAEYISWLKEYVDEKYRPEPKRRQKPASFKGAVRPAEE